MKKTALFQDFDEAWEIITHIVMTLLILYFLSGCRYSAEDSSLGPNSANPTADPVQEVILNGTIQDVAASARVIHLQENLAGTQVIALLEGYELLDSAQKAVSLQELQPGMNIQVYGRPGESGSLLASRVVVLEQQSPTATPSGAQGTLSFPFRSADAGNFILQAGKEITITWDNPPGGAESYEIYYMPLEDGSQQLVGVDDPEKDGVTVVWLVPENLSGQLTGIAWYTGDIRVWSLSPMVYSGEIPAEDSCNLSFGGIEAIPIYPHPEAANNQFAMLIPGEYAPVLKQTRDGWYLIDTQSAIYPNTTTDSTTGKATRKTGWVQDGHGLILHGPCDHIPYVAGAEDSP